MEIDIDKAYENIQARRNKKYQKQFKKILKKDINKNLLNKVDKKNQKRFLEYQERSVKKNNPFDLTFDEFKNMLSLNCSYCDSSSQMTIDRIDSTKGYVYGNVQPCCFKCNHMKYVYTNDDFLAQIKRIYSFMEL